MKHLTHYVRCGDVNAVCSENCEHCAMKEARLNYEVKRNSRRASKGLAPHPDEQAFRIKSNMLKGATS